MVPGVSKRGGVWLFDPPKANKQARLVDRKACFTSEVGNWGVERGWTSLQRLTPPTGNEWGESFHRQRQRAPCRNAQSALTAIFRLVSSGLTSVMLLVSGTANLQLQGWFISVSLRAVLRIVAA